MRAKALTHDDHALLLRVVPHGESSAIASYFTRQHGKLSLVLRGGRASVRRMPLAREPFHTLTLRFRRGAGELGTLLAAELVAPRLAIAETLPASFAAGQALRWLAALCAPEQADPPLFDAASAHLDALCTMCSNSFARSAGDLTSEAVQTWQLRCGLSLLAHAGYALQLERCVACARPRPHGRAAWLSATAGGVICRECTGRAQAARPVLLAAAVLDWLAQPSAPQPPAAALAPLHELLHAALKMHNANIAT